MVEHDILKNAINNFRKTTGMVIDLMPVKKISKSRSKNPVADAHLAIRHGTHRIQFLVEIKNEIREMHIMQLLGKFADEKDKWILIAQYIPKPVKAELKKYGVNYLEASGNCYINRDGVLLFVNDQKVEPLRKGKSGKLWNQAGIRFVFAVLTSENLLAKPYREIAKSANVALGNVGSYIEELKDEGFITTSNENDQEILQLSHKTKLITKWVTVYHIELRPKITVGRYRFLSAQSKIRTAIQVLDEDKANNQFRRLGYVKEGETIDDVLTSDQTGVYWSGEVAGAILTGRLRPEKYTFYTSLSQSEIMAQLKLVPDEKGDVEVLETFWNNKGVQGEGLKIAPKLLVYADLLTSLDSRNREIADQVRKDFLDE